MRKYFLNLRKRLTRVYRILLIDDETLSQSRPYLIKPITLIMIGLLLLLLVVGGTASLIVFTPTIREQIPGYLNPEYDQKQKLLLAEIDELKQTIEQRDSLLIVFQDLSREFGPIDAKAEPQNNRTEEENIAQATVLPARQIAMEEEETAAPANAPIKVVYVPSGGAASNLSPSSVLLKLYAPVEGVIRRKFNLPDKHYGVDIVAGENELVYAATDGFVIFAEYSEKDGHVIGVANNQDVVTFYKHNSRLLKKVGSPVIAGEPIAVIGNSGENSTGPHLHFELWYRGQPVDPLNYYASFE